MDRREFQLIEGSSKKFWAIQLNGTSFTVHFGRIGTSGQAQEKSFPTEEAAKREYDKLILEKTKKGYAEVGADGTSVALSTSVPATVTKKATAAKTAGKKKPADEAEEPNPASPETPPPPAEIRSLQRTIKLSPEDRIYVTWLAHEPLPKPEPPPFALKDALNRLRAVGTSSYIWDQDWRKARIPDFPSSIEARFWLVAYEKCRNAAGMNPQQVADQLANFTSDSAPSIAEIEHLLRMKWRVTDNIEGCVAALLRPEDFIKPESGRELAEVFRTHVLPFLSQEEREHLRKELDGRITPMIPATNLNSWPAYYSIGAWLGCHEQIAAVTRAFPDNYFSDPAEVRRVSYHRPQWFVFGLPDRQTVVAEFKRVGLTLHNSEQARAWLALTEFDGLDVLAASVCQASSRKEDAAQLARTLSLVIAPEAALPALQISIASKAQQIGKEWLFAHPLEAAVGLTPVATGQGKIAEAAREHLMGMRRGPQADALTAALPHLSPAHQEWLQREILDNEEETMPEISRDEMPEDLRNSLTGKAPALPAWVSMSPLPPIKVQGKKLAAADVPIILGALKTTPLGSSTPLLSALKSHADRNSLDNFAWKLFSTWLGNSAPSKEKWAMGAIGHLGGDASVLKLTPLIREWPGESQHQRAVFGLECLRAVGSDTAMMALNGIAQKLKFKGLKEKAQAMMEEIAQARGLTREQLADRIVPDCGLDERGSRVFDFGPRQFRFVLGPEMKPLVRDAAGKVRPDLPAPNSSDNREKADAAVADWKLLKKTLRELLKIQADRLEDAMITGRRWTVEEFDALFVRHPLMINLIRQLIFGVYDETGKVAHSFRVTEDQTFADHNDEEVEKPANGQIGIVHPAHLDNATSAAWGQILSDYEIIPPFQQLNRAICQPDPEDLDKTTIDRYRGPKVPGIVMYGMLERSHWLRDIPADGGGFVQHSRYFPSANLTAFIQYTGMSIGYYEEPQELEQVYFVPGHVKPDWWGDHKNRLKLKDVDPVVISEVLRLANAIISKAE